MKYVIILCLLFIGCGSVKKDKKEKEIHYELVTTLRDSLVITHEKKETVTERVIERKEDKKENADNYKRTDKDGTIHEYFNYNTEIKTDEKTIENVLQLFERYNVLEVKNKTLNERLSVSEKETNKLREQIDMFKLILQISGALLVIYIIWRLYKKYKKTTL